MPIDPSDAHQVAAALLDYLRGRLGVAEMGFAEAPAPIGRGFDTYIYAFRLAGDGLPEEWARPLVLRIYPTPDQGELAGREAAVQRFVAARGYPALTPLAAEREAAGFGLPIMVMERAAGRTMLECGLSSPLAIRRLLALMAEQHVALHRLLVEGCPLPSDGPLVVRQLTDLRETVTPLPSEEMEAAFSWLDAHKDSVTSEEPSLCHGDFHPINIMVGEDGAVTVLDWSLAVVGDRHFDVARTLVLFWMAPIAARSPLERLLLRATRGFFARRYLTSYAKQYPIDPQRLRYWQAYHAFQGWLQVTVLHSQSSEALGVKPESLDQIPLSLAHELRRYFWRQARQ